MHRETSVYRRECMFVSGKRKECIFVSGNVKAKQRNLIKFLTE